MRVNVEQRLVDVLGVERVSVNVLRRTYSARTVACTAVLDPRWLRTLVMLSTGATLDKVFLRAKYRRRVANGAHRVDVELSLVIHTGAENRPCARTRLSDLGDVAAAVARLGRTRSDDRSLQVCAAALAKTPAFVDLCTAVVTAMHARFADPAVCTERVELIHALRATGRVVDDHETAERLYTMGMEEVVASGLPSASRATRRVARLFDTMPRRRQTALVVLAEH